jgi:hypothetical protein
MEGQSWYREPQTFVAVAALIVSVTAVVVGFYEASLQRRHDRAEVWPHLEISTFVVPDGAAIKLANTGIGPAIVKSISVEIDGKPQRNWDNALRTLLGRNPSPHSSSTVTEHAFRAGDEVTLVGIPKSDMPTGFWNWVGRVRLRVCYVSVFDESWIVSDDHLGGNSKWASVGHCPAPAPGTDL